MPVYNAAPFLEESVGSVLAQTFEEFELIIIDDASTDQSLEVISSFKDDRIRLVRHAVNMQLVATLNEGLELSRGKYIARMDADDICRRDRLKYQYDYMEANPRTAVVGAGISLVGGKMPLGEQVSGPDFTKAALLFSCVIPHPTVMMRVDLIRLYGWKYSGDHLHCEDFALWNEVVLKHDVDIMQKVLLEYRNHANQVSNKHNLVQRQGLHAIRMTNLDRLGVRLDSGEESVFRELMNLEFEYNQDFLCKCENILLKISSGNDNTGYVPAYAMNAVLGRWWYNLVGSLMKRRVRIGRYALRSPLSSNRFLDDRHRLKMRFKSLLLT